MIHELHHKYITRPAQLYGDGIGLCDGDHWHVHHCIVDFTDCPLDEVDEALGITWGSSADVHDCVFRGAGKLVLLGCGDSPLDEPNVVREYGKEVRFTRCLFENFGRRGPEVQDWMVAKMTECVIRNWGTPGRFTERAFGAWAHAGGKIVASNCVFDQRVKPGLWLWLRDHIGHIGQAVNDYGLLGLFTRDAWLSGYRRALTAAADGEVECRHCYATDPRLVLDGAGKHPAMDADTAYQLMVELDEMAFNLEMTFRLIGEELYNAD